MQWMIQLNSLIKLMVSCDLLHSMVTNQGASKQWDLHLPHEFKRMMDHCYQALVSNLEALGAYYHFYLTVQRSDSILELFTVIYFGLKNFKC